MKSNYGVLFVNGYEKTGLTYYQASLLSKFTGSLLYQVNV